MIDFILKYWIEFLFGLIVLVGGIAFKYLSKLIKKDQHEKLQEQFNGFYNKINDNLLVRFDTLEEEDRKINNRLDDMERDLRSQRKGILSLHRRKFLDDCRQFLDNDKEITLEDFNRVQREHKVYNDLGGNHEGDENWELFKAKYEAQLKRGA